MTARFTLVIREGDVIEEVAFVDEAGKQERFDWMSHPHLEHIEVTVIDNLTQAFEVVEFPGIDAIDELEGDN
jgi:hypothetical protein